MSRDGCGSGPTVTAVKTKTFTHTDRRKTRRYKECATNDGNRCQRRKTLEGDSDDNEFDDDDNMKTMMLTKTMMEIAVIMMLVS